MSSTPKNLKFEATPEKGSVSAILLRPRGARRLLILGHGAGAPMTHPFMEAAATELADVGIATFRYQFPYMEKGRGGPDTPKVLTATVRSAVKAARKAAPKLSLIAGGKSMGGRMTSLAASQEPLTDVEGLVFFGFPLHAPGKPGSERAEHLNAVKIPMLFLQGTRDKLADLEHLRPVCKRLKRRAKLHVVEEADHSFNVPKRTGKTQAEIIKDLAETIDSWLQ